MSDFEPADPPGPSRRFRSALKAARWLLVAIAALAALAVWLFAVPLGVAIFGALVLAALGLLAVHGAASFVDAPVRRRPAGPPVWPETGMKVLLDAVPAPCFLTGRDGVVRFANAPANLRFGHSRLGDPLSLRLRVSELLAAVERVGAGGATESVRFTERVPVERVYVAAVVPVSLPARAPSGQPDFVLVLLDDRTESVRLDRMRSDFVANASHELRTPLASVSGFIETLLGPARDDAASRERFLKIMLGEAARMSRLIDDLLSLSRIETKAALGAGDTADLAAVVRHVLDALAPLAATQGITIDGPPAGIEATVRGDRDELVQLTSNLVENAIKYGRENGKVTIAIAAEPGPDGVAGFSLTVSDDGPGIEPRHLPRLTERFYRVDASRSREKKGTGLGLAIVKHIVNRHRGRLGIKSEPGRGTAFTVWLEAPAASSLSEESKQEQLDRMS
jgi:two-component system phosphate regulon sensor histidine kinase PhoR